MTTEHEPSAEPRDYTKIIWGVVALIFIAMILAVSFSKRTASNSSQAEVKHILVKVDSKDPAQRERALETITDLRKRILAGESFEKLANEYSEDPQSGPRGGYLGWGDKGVYDPKFEDYVWHAKLNQLSEVITTSYGYHLIMVTNRHLSQADEYDAKIEAEAAKTAPKVEVNVPKGLPQAAPAQPEVPLLTLPKAPPASVATPAPAPAAAATPAPAPAPGQ